MPPDAFLARYCLDCHGGEAHKGDRRLDDLPLTIGTDRPVTTLVDADFTFLTEGRARFYGLKDAFDRQRALASGAGGADSAAATTLDPAGPPPVLPPAGMLHLGTPPSPPPPDVPPIEPDIRGATTVRQQLEKHRAVQACADCHAKIDPLGFADVAGVPPRRRR